MLEPLTITVSALTFIKTASEVLSKGRDLYRAPSIVNGIIEDVANSEILVSSIRDALQNTASSAFITQDDQDRLVALFERAKAKLLQIDMILQYELINQQTYTQKIKVSRVTTVRKKGDVKQLRQEFKDLTDGIGKVWQGIIV